MLPLLNAGVAKSGSRVRLGFWWDVETFSRGESRAGSNPAVRTIIMHTSYRAGNFLLDASIALSIKLVT